MLKSAICKCFFVSVFCFLSASFVVIISDHVVADEVADLKQARELSQYISDNIIKINKQYKGNSDKMKKIRYKKLEKLFDNSIDFLWMGRFVTGRYWKTSNEAGKKQFLTSYKKFMKNVYIQSINKYNVSKIDIVDAKKLGNNRYQIRGKILQTDSAMPLIKINIRMRKKKDKMYIYDMVFEGISFISSQREEFSQLFSSKGLSGVAEDLDKHALSRRQK